MDILFTLALVVAAYYGYRWYNGLQEQVRGPQAPGLDEDDEEVIVIRRAPRDAAEDDYTDYEEIKE